MLIDPDECVDHRLAAEGDCHFVLLGGASARSQHHDREFLTIANNLGGKPLALEAGERRRLDELEFIDRSLR